MMAQGQKIVSLKKLLNIQYSENTLTPEAEIKGKKITMYKAAELREAEAEIDRLTPLVAIGTQVRMRELELERSRRYKLPPRLEYLKGGGDAAHGGQALADARIVLEAPEVPRQIICLKTKQYEECYILSPEVVIRHGNRVPVTILDWHANVRSWEREGSSSTGFATAFMAQARELVNKSRTDSNFWEDGKNLEAVVSLDKDFKEAEKRHIAWRWPSLVNN